MVTNNAHLDRCAAYLLSHMTQEDKKEVKPRPRITIALSREAGAGVMPLADELASYLSKEDPDKSVPWTVFDKNLVRQVMEDHKLPERLLNYMEEDRPPMLETVMGEMLGLHPPASVLVQKTGQTVYRLARLGNCILVGRGATAVTRGMPNVLRVRLIASRRRRVRYWMELYNISETEARDRIRAEDKARKRYVMAWYDQDVEDPLNYHMVINMDDFTPEKFAQTIGDMALHWGKVL